VFRGCKTNAIKTYSQADDGKQYNHVRKSKENIVEVPLTNVYFPATWSLIKQLSANLRQHFSFFF
jgi:hypothetical protein